MSARSQEELRKVADALRGFRGEVHLSANADTSGSASANMMLSIRRGRTVAAALIALGVAPSTIQIRASGEARPAVPTGDGVSEFLNRAVHIDWLPTPAPGQP